MYQVFNMGHRMEVYCEPDQVQQVIDCASVFDIDARLIARTEPSGNGSNQLQLHHEGEVFNYP